MSFYESYVIDEIFYVWKTEKGDTLELSSKMEMYDDNYKIRATLIKADGTK